MDETQAAWEQWKGKQEEFSGSWYLKYADKETAMYNAFKAGQASQSDLIAMQERVIAELQAERDNKKADLFNAQQAVLQEGMMVNDLKALLKEATQFEEMQYGISIGQR